MNNVVLIGRLVREPELRYLSSTSTAVCQFTIAVDKNLSKDKKTQFEAQGKPTADFIRIVVWGKQGENCSKYLEKGQKVAINGSISTSSYKTQTGETRYSTDIIASSVEFLEKSDKKGGGSSMSDDMADFSGFSDDEFQVIENNGSIPF